MHNVQLLLKRRLTHDVRQFVVSKPDGFTFEPGQGVEVALEQERWRDEGRPFTPISLPGDPVLEFAIKVYPDRDDMTKPLHALETGAPLRISDPFGKLTYRGPGIFIGAGAGLTPLLAILRDLDSKGRLDGHGLIFSNKTPADVFCEKELRLLLGERCILTCTREQAPGYDFHRIDRDYLERRLPDQLDDRWLYVCGPPSFVEQVRGHLADLGAKDDRIVIDED